MLLDKKRKEIDKSRMIFFIICIFCKDKISLIFLRRFLKKEIKNLMRQHKVLELNWLATKLFLFWIHNTINPKKQDLIKSPVRALTC